MILPIYAHKEELLRLVYDHAVVVVSGETGCGKTTQIPQYLYDCPKLTKLAQSWHPNTPDYKPNLVIVQPHRIAAISMARRVAEERKTELGQLVGYTVRWDSLADPKLTKIRYVTDGILVKEYISGKDFHQWDFIVIDEAHERSLNIDVLLALIKRYLKSKIHLSVYRIPIRFIITSATLDVEKFSGFFGDAPSLKVPGRLFPVAIKNVPVRITRAGSDSIAEEDDEIGGLSIPEDESQLGQADKANVCYRPGIKRRRQNEKDQVWLSPDAAITASVTIAQKIHTETPVATGHILCFLAGAGECERAVQLMHQKLQEVAELPNVASALVIPLYGALDAQQQANVFVEVPSDCRKIVFATNVAETSLTIDGIGHIVDSGVVKQTFYQPKSGMVSLNRVPVSKVQAKQRAGRAGRTKDGTCWRLYAEETYNQLEEYTVPEILRSDPSSAVLNLLAMNIRDILYLEFIDTPNKLSVALALKELATLGAIYQDTLEVSRIGRAMSQTPLDPIYARCFIASLEYDVVEEVATILALLSAEQVYTVPKTGVEDQPDISLADVYKIKHRKFRDISSDHMTLTNVFAAWKKRRGSDARLFRKEELYDWCWDNQLSMRALLTAEKIQRQLIELMPEIELIVGTPTDPRFLESVRQMRKRERVLRTLCQGLFINSAKLLISKSMSKALGWTSAREGIIVRPAAQSSLGELIDPDKKTKEPTPSWIIYDQLVSIAGASGQPTGLVRIASAIEYEWIAPLITRLYKVIATNFHFTGVQTSLDDLVEVLEEASPRRDQKRKNSNEDPLAPYSMQSISNIDLNDADAAFQVPESTIEERANKIAHAKAKLENRKKNAPN